MGGYRFPKTDRAVGTLMGGICASAAETLPESPGMNWRIARHEAVWTFVQRVRRGDLTSLDSCPKGSARRSRAPGRLSKGLGEAISHPWTFIQGVRRGDLESLDVCPKAPRGDLAPLDVHPKAPRGDLAPLDVRPKAPRGDLAPLDVLRDQPLAKSRDIIQAPIGRPGLKMA